MDMSACPFGSLLAGIKIFRKVRLLARKKSDYRNKQADKAGAAMQHLSGLRSF